MSTATDGELVARCQRFERRLLEYMDAWPRDRSTRPRILGR
jgi:hypothetical protein